MPEDAEKLSAVAGHAGGLRSPPEDAAAPEKAGGITLPAVLTGAILLLILAWGLPYWSLAKRMSLGMGGYLPLEALALTLALLAFNRFRGAWLLVAGLVSVAILAPWWHAAAYTHLSPGTLASDVLNAPSAWLYDQFKDLIEAPDQTGNYRGKLVFVGAGLAFAAGALVGWLVTLALPALRRRFHWREVAVVFVLLSVGTYSCKSIEFLVGVLAVPYKDDSAERNYRGRITHPVPPGQLKVTSAQDRNRVESEKARAALEQAEKGTDQAAIEGARARVEFLSKAGRVQALSADAESTEEERTRNRPGIPPPLVPYDPFQFDEPPRSGLPSQKEERLRLQREERLQKEEQQALEAFKKGYLQGAPDPAKMPDRAKREEHRRQAWDAFLDRWKGPLAWWLPLLGLILLVQIFLAAMLRRQWSDHEKLMFPHAEVVRALAEGEEVTARGRRILSSRALWLGAGLAMGLGLLQGLNAYFPWVPAPNLHRISLAPFISDRPWTAMEKNLNLQPFLVGIAYLLTAEISLSIWFFALVNQALRVFASASGLLKDEALALHGEWANSDALYIGGMVMFVLWLAWGGRRHIWYVLRRALGMYPADSGESREPMSYPVAFWGFWLSVAAILGWCVLAGLQLWVMAVLFGLYLVMVVLVCRVVCEAGLLAAGLQTWPFYPQFVFCHVFGFGTGLAYKDSWLSTEAAKVAAVPATVRCLGVWSFIWPSLLAHLQMTPFFLAGFKLTETEPRRKRLLTAAMVAAVVAAGALFLHGTMTYAFEKGADSASFFGFNCSGWIFSNWLLRDAVTKERMWTPDKVRLGMMIGGMVVMAGLLVLRSFFYWWPLHPIGFAATGAEWGLWFGFLLGWLFKRAALAYGGGEFSQRLNPFFYGLIVGQFIMAAVWNIVLICGDGSTVMDATGILPGARN